MEPGSNLWVRWKTEIATAYVLTFAIVFVLVDYLPISLTDSSSTITSAFLSFLKAQLLPSGWVLLGLGNSKFEVEISTSALLAFLVCCPIATYAMLRLISPPKLGKSTFVSLVVGAAVLSYQGAILGLILDHFYLLTFVPFFPDVSIAIALGTYDFYMTMLRGILGWSLALIMPLYIVMFLERRRAHGLRWHL